MATTLEHLIAAKEAWAAEMESLAARPNYNIDAEGFDFDEFVQRGAALDAAIASAQGPVVVESQGVV